MMRKKQGTSRLMAAVGAAGLAIAPRWGPVRLGAGLQFGISHCLAPLFCGQRGCQGGWFLVRDRGSPARLPQSVGGED